MQQAAHAGSGICITKFLSFFNTRSLEISSPNLSAHPHRSAYRTTKLTLWTTMLLRLLIDTYALVNTLDSDVGCTLVFGLGYDTASAVCGAVGFQPIRLSNAILNSTLYLFRFYVQLFFWLHQTVYGAHMQKGQVLLVCNNRSQFVTVVINSIAHDARALRTKHLVADRQILTLPVSGATVGLLDFTLR